MITLPKRRTTGVFLAADRCDRCGARALLRVVLRTGELLFCAHHGRKHEAGFEPLALWIEQGTAFEPVT